MRDVTRYRWALLSALGLLACGDEDATLRDGGARSDASMDATIDATHIDARVDGTAPTTTWVATKTTLDVWWEGSANADPLRDSVEILTLSESVGACDADGNPKSTRICGITLPTYTNDQLCTAYSFAIPDEAWDAQQMPLFRSNTDANNEDDAGSADQVATALLGIELPGGSATGSWPTAGQAEFNCAAGMGATCLPDHDNDGSPGLTARARTDGAAYTGPNDDGLCLDLVDYPTLNRVPYRYDTPYLTWPGPLPCPGCGGPWSDPRATALHVALRLRQSTRLNAMCSGQQQDDVSSIDLRVVQCAVDPSTLDPGTPPYWPADPRIASRDYACTTDEARFVDGYFPQLHVLASGEAPDETPRPHGWAIQDRDIDRTPSEGTKSVSVVMDIGDLDAGEDEAPSCAQVRAALRGL